MEKISNYTTTNIINKILGKHIHFKSDCMLFPNDGIKGKVISYQILSNGEILFKIKLKNGKQYDIGSNTSNLQFEII